MKKTKNIILIIILLIVLGTLFYFGFNFFQGITGETIVEIENLHSYTKAFCNDSNYCEDFTLNCQGGEVVSIISTGATIQNPPNWKDPRDKETIERLC